MSLYDNTDSLSPITADYVTLFEIEDSDGHRAVLRRFTGPEAAAMRALCEAEDIELIDDEDVSLLSAFAPPPMTRATGGAKDDIAF